MRPGIVATIRVNPKDCMAVLDVMDAVGITSEGMSFPAMASLTLSSLLQTARDNKQIPDRSGFEYAEMMQPYVNQPRTRRKLEITNALHQVGSEMRITGLSDPRQGAFELAGRSDGPESESIDAPVELEVTGEMLRDRRRLTELLQKKDMADDGKPGVLWQASDQLDYDEVFKRVYPEG